MADFAGWTEHQVDQLTGNANTLRDGKRLASASRWSRTGSAEPVAWGECKGSAKEPYRVCFASGNEIGYKCTCPSGKRPCKHVVALAQLLAIQPALFATAPPPDWVVTWQTNRQRLKTRAEKVAAKAASAGTKHAPDPSAQAGRVEARERKVRAGLDELSAWLRDLARRGFTDDRVRTYEFWDRIAARMVDAQAASIARRLRGLAAIPIQGAPDWADRLLDEVSSLYLLAQSYRRLNTLSPETQADIRAAVGWTIKQDDLLSQPGLKDHWRVLGQTLELDDRLRARRVWLHGAQSGRKAVLLDFAHGSATFEDNFTTGVSFGAELVFYPGAYPLRAVLKRRTGPQTDDAALDAGFDCADIPAALDQYASALARNPWLWRFPFALRAVIPFAQNGRAGLRDTAGRVLPMVSGHQPYLYAAISGNQPLPIFGEWDGREFTPITAMTDGMAYPLA